MGELRDQHCFVVIVLLIVLLQQGQCSGPKQCYGKPHFRRCRQPGCHSSIVNPLVPVESNVTLWIMFDASNFSSATNVTTEISLHVQWIWCYAPNKTLSHQLSRINGSFYNTSLQVHKVMKDTGRYVVYVNERLLQTFVLSDDPDADGKCLHVSPHLSHITSPGAVVPSLPGKNISLTCNLIGYALDYAMYITWSNSARKTLHHFPFSSEMQPVDKRLKQNESCLFYHQLVIMNASSSLSDNYTCVLYNNDKTTNISTSLTIIDLPKFFHFPRDQLYSVQGDPVSLIYVIQGKREYIVPKLTINGTEITQYCRSTAECNITIDIEAKPGYSPQTILKLNMDTGSMDTGSYDIQACAYMNTTTVSHSYAEEYNNGQQYLACYRTALTVQNGKQLWLIIGTGGSGVAIILLVFLAVVGVVVCRRRRQFATGDSERSPLLHNNSNNNSNNIGNTFPDQSKGRLITTAQTGRSTLQNGAKPPSFVQKDGRPCTAASWQQVVKKVFIVYCKEVLEAVAQMCDILNHLSSLDEYQRSFVCDCDIQHRDEVSNDWSNWTVQQIREADIVLLVCSPQLHACLSQVKDPPPIQTATGLVSASAIANLCSILRNSSGKFVPVFLNQPVDHELIPTSLMGRIVYQVTTCGLMSIQHDNIAEFKRTVQDYLNANMDGEARGLIELVSCLKSN